MQSYQVKKKQKTNKSIYKNNIRHKNEKKCNLSAESTKHSDDTVLYNMNKENKWCAIKIINDEMAEMPLSNENFVNLKTLRLRERQTNPIYDSNCTNSSDCGSRQCLCVFDKETAKHKRKFRFLADFFSFLCGVCVWGICDDLVIILSKDNILMKLFLYGIFTIISAVVAVTIS